MSGEEKQSQQPSSSGEPESDHQARKAEILKNSRFTPKVEERLRADKFDRSFPDLPGEPRAVDLWAAEKWRQLIGKKLDPDILGCVAQQLECEDAKERAWDDLREQRVTYEDFAKTMKDIAERKSNQFASLCDLAFQGKDAEFFRAVAEILDFVRDNGIPAFNEWSPDTGEKEKGEFLFVWKVRAHGIPATCEDRIPSFDELWRLGCDLFKWDKGRWQSGDDSAKMKDRFRKFLGRDCGLPYRKAPR